jgi:cold-inducible RNA-binding protein
VSKRLFIGNLDFSTTEQQLRDAFGEFGSIADATLVTDRMTGQSRGFGFIEFDNDGDADRAIEQMDNTTLGGRTIKVNEARERSSGGDRGGRGGGGFRGGRGGGGGGGGGRGGRDHW